MRAGYDGAALINYMPRIGEQFGELYLKHMTFFPGEKSGARLFT